jgi:hypothetical protein
MGRESRNSEAPKAEFAMPRERSQKTDPDLFSIASLRNIVPPLTDQVVEIKAAPSPRHVLPKNLPEAIKHLDDQELDRLLAAGIAEQRRRGKRHRVSDQTTNEQLMERAPSSLKRGQMNAVRAAFKAGVKPSQIARQFGISQSDVRKALASDEAKQ